MTLAEHITRMKTIVDAMDGLTPAEFLTASESLLDAVDAARAWAERAPTDVSRDIPIETEIVDDGEPPF